MLKELNLKMPVTLVGGEKVTITVKDMYYLERDKPKYNDYMGYVNIIYPFSGLDLKIKVDMHWDYIDELNDDTSFKIPFANTKSFYHDIVMAKQEEESDPFESVEKCECGGTFMPMYDEFPNWISFCTKCDQRMENVDHSPLPY